MVCPSGLGITLQLLSLIGLCLLWNNNGFISPLRSAERIRITCYGQSWSQHNLPFSSLTSTPSTVQQLSTEILMNANATATTTAGSAAVGGSVGSGDAMTLKKELTALRTRVEKVEKSALLLSGKRRTSVSDFVESLQANTMAMNAKTVEMCAVFTFFTIGTIVGASLLDRLWLLGGIFAAWWSSGAVHKDTRGGMLARRVGVQVAQLIRDVQEKYNQFVIFYRTGKLAYISSKTWEQYDAKYSITLRINDFKRRAMRRATDFNKGQELSDQLSDLWQVVVSAPKQARQIDKKYGVTDTVFAFSRGIYNTVSDGLSSVVYAGQDRKSPPSKNYKNKNNNNRKSSMFGFLFKLNPNATQRTNQIRGRHINPWRPFWQFLNRNKKTEKKKLTWFQSLLYVETPTVGNKLLAG